MLKRSQTLVVLSALIWGVCAGCGSAGGESAAKTLIPVKGKVTYKGNPLTKGRVKFEPDGFGRNAYGKIQADGTFTLTTDKEGDGAVAGHHRVAVIETGIKSPRDAVAKKYASVSSSGLTADVDASNTEFTFDLK
ncbi:MAG: hypothetical protein ACYC61_19075 [Isosphaeraceae bacterium]